MWGGFCYRLGWFGLATATVLCSSSLRANDESPPAYESILRGGGTGDDVARAVVVDHEGNIYVTGSMGSTNADLGTVVLTNPPYSVMFLAKFDSRRNLLWIRQAANSPESQGNAIALDVSGGIYVTGFFRSQAIFGDVTVNGHGNRDVFVVKYDTDGVAVWGTSAGGPGDDIALGIAVDAAANMYITGLFRSGTATFGDFTVTNAGASDMFLARLDSSGKFLWAVSAGGPGENEGGFAIFAEPGGKVYVTGQFWSGAWFGKTNLTTGGYGSRLFVAKYDIHGDLIWVSHSTAADYEYGNAIGRGIIVDASENVYVTGYFVGAATFGDRALRSGWWGDFFDSKDMFLLKLDCEGNFLWVRATGARLDDEGRSLALDQSGNCYVSGGFLGQLDLGNTITSRGGLDVFVTKFNPAGDILWATSAGGAGDDFPYGMALIAENRILIAGSFQSTASFGDHQIASRGGTDLFLAKLTPLAPVLSIPENLVITNERGVCGASVTFSIGAADPSMPPNSSPPPISCTYTSGQFFPVGVTTNVCTVTGAYGDQVSGWFTVSVLDLEPPVVESLAALPPEIWPPNHKLVPVQIKATAADNCGVQSMRIVSIESSDSVEGHAPDDFWRDWLITGDLTMLLRAERRSVNKANIYTITVEVKDTSGNKSRKTTTVSVRDHQ